MYKKKPFFIVFEGVEGCGKSFQSKKLLNNLKKKRIPALLTREPGGTQSAELIRNLILKDYFTKKVHFQQRVSLFFNRYLFQPLLKAFDCLSKNIQKLQSGDINFYNAIILLVLILALVSVLL